LLDAGPRWSNLLIRAAARNFTEFQGWWQGAFGDGELRAIACVSSHHFANIYGTPLDAVSALGDSMVRAAAGRASQGGTHRLFGEEAIIDTYWERFKTINRTKVDDRIRNLVRTETSGEVKKAYEVRRATEADAPLVAEFAAEQQVEQGGVDPRRGNREGWDAMCRQNIADGRTLVGFQRGKPAFSADLSIDEGTAMLDRLYVPRPLRRPKVVAGMLGAACQLALGDADEVLAFVDADKEPWPEATEAAGMGTMCKYRMIVLR